jgi:hypothetical protein
VAGLVLTPVSISGLLTVVAVLAVLANVTVIQRVWFVWRQSRASETRPVAATATMAAAEPARAKVEEREVRPGPEPAGG